MKKHYIVNGHILRPENIQVNYYRVSPRIEIGFLAQTGSGEKVNFMLYSSDAFSFRLWLGKLSVFHRDFFDGVEKAHKADQSAKAIQLDLLGGVAS